MQRIRRNYHWVIALVGVISLVGAALVYAQKDPAKQTVIPLPSAEPGRAVEGLDAAKSLSAAFRRVAREAIPAIVSIETVSKSVATRGEDLEQSLEGTPFEEFFRMNPRFQEMFKQRQNPRRQFRQRSEGSGFIISAQGIVMTNNHVVAGAETVKVKLKDGREFIATDIKGDPRTDVAIVRIKSDEPLPVVRLGNSDAVEIGDWVLAIGSPFGLETTVTAGIISAKGRGPGITEREDFLQTDAAINPGNSGGPLLSLDGEVIGMNTAISTRSGGYDGVGFAVPVNMAKWVSEQLIQQGAVRRTYLGVAIQPIDAKLAAQLKVPLGKGAIVTEVFPGSPAESIKLERGDVILKVDGVEVNGTRSLQSIVERLKPETKYPLVVIRDGKEMALSIAPREMPKDYTVSLRNPKARTEEHEAEPAEPKSTKVETLGLEVSDTSQDALKELGYDRPVHGAVITTVSEDGPAASAGLRAGMVIEKVGNKGVRSAAEFQAAVKDLPLSKGVLLLVRSPRGSQFVVVKQEPAAK